MNNLEIQKFIDGVNEAIHDFQNKEITDIEGAIAGFELDTADTPFQAGYLEGLVGINDEGIMATIGTLTSGELRKVLENEVWLRNNGIHN
jgi:hypothetical protein